MKSKKPYIITGALFIYMAAMAIMNSDTLTVQHDYLRYFGTLLAEAVILCILFFFLRKREILREERKADLIRAEQERKELDAKLQKQENAKLLKQENQTDTTKESDTTNG